MTDAGDRPGDDRPGVRDGEHRFPPRLVPSARLAALRRVQRRIAGRPGIHPETGGDLRPAAGDGEVPGAARCPVPPHDRRDAGGAPRQLRGVGRAREPADDCHRRLARGPDLDGVRDPAGCVRRRRCSDDRHDPRDLVFDGRTLTAGGQTDRSGLQAGAHQRHPEPPRRVSRAGRRLQCQGRLCRQHVPVQAGAQEGVLRRPHRQPARGPLLRRSARGDPRSRALDANPGRHLARSGRADARASSDRA